MVFLLHDPELALGCVFYILEYELSSENLTYSSLRWASHLGDESQEVFDSIKEFKTQTQHLKRHAIKRAGLLDQQLHRSLPNVPSAKQTETPQTSGQTRSRYLQFQNQHHVRQYQGIVQLRLARRVRNDTVRCRRRKEDKWMARTSPSSGYRCRHGLLSVYQIWGPSSGSACRGVGEGARESEAI